MLLRKAAAWLELFRPLEWSKSFTFMVIGSTLALFWNHLPILSSWSVFHFLVGFVLVNLLWSGLYGLNDFTDWKSDLLHETKKFRPIPSHRVKPFHALFVSVLLVGVS